jgi:hypothetical protein
MIRDYISGRDGASQNSDRLEVVPSLLLRTVELHTTTPYALASYEVQTRGSHLDFCVFSTKALFNIFSAADTLTLSLNKGIT